MTDHQHTVNEYNAASGCLQDPLRNKFSRPGRGQSTVIKKEPEQPLPGLLNQPTSVPKYLSLFPSTRIHALLQINLVRVLEEINKPPKFLTTTRLLQLSDCFRFNLPDTLAGHLKNVADLLERIAVAVTESVA